MRGGGFLPGFTVERGCWAVFALLLCGCVSGALSVGGTLCDGCSARRAWLVVPLAGMVVSVELAYLPHDPWM